MEISPSDPACLYNSAPSPNGVPLKPAKECRKNPKNEQFLSERGEAREFIASGFFQATERTRRAVSWGALSLVLSCGQAKKVQNKMGHIGFEPMTSTV